MCSFLNFTCSPPVEYPNKFDNWYDCMLKAHDESVELLMTVPQDVVESNRLATKYTCTQSTDV